jgi:Rps23 Pro-64 3,4-dihydroxylase Tpa1-like proline 4-hydroxylase
MIRSDIDWNETRKQFLTAEPFNHVVIDNFFLPDIAEELSQEFPDPNSEDVVNYSNPLEVKKAMNRWDKFPSTTYQTFSFFGREVFLEYMRSLVGERTLWLDFGLNGGGWHMHGRGGNNNVHLDYNIHPKLNEQRKLNIIVYLTKDWNPEWNGGLEIWSHDEETKQPKEMVKKVDNVFNRAIIFDTTQNSWHGLPKYITCPEGIYRKSIAAYFVRPAPEGTEKRGRALFAPREEQKNDLSVKELIAKRADVTASKDVYRQ